MSSSTDHIMMNELRAALALGEELTAEESTELEAWLRENPDQADDFSLELTAAAIELSVADSADSMPASLRAKLNTLAAEFDRGVAAQGVPLGSIRQHEAHSTLHTETTQFVHRHSGTESRSVMIWRQRATLGWAAAVIAFSAAMVGWFMPRENPGNGYETASLESKWADFAYQYPDAQRAEWGDWALAGEGPAIEGVRGEVIWSEEAQTGLMRFEGLPANDPSQLQYQLWIVDKRGLFDENGQSARISGGVFDGPRVAQGEAKADDGDESVLIVPIEPRLLVQGAGAFAVTIEEPGGVWASDMSKRVVIAALGSG
jgi:hypothetical protein